MSVTKRGASFWLGSVTSDMPSEALPSEVFVELTDACNANCPSCDYARSIKKPRTYLPRAGLEVLLGELERSAITVYFMGGEPLLHQDLGWFMTELRNRCSWHGEAHLFSNGALTGPAHDSLWLNLDSVGFSVDGVRGMSSCVRGLTGQEDRVAKTVRRLLELRKGGRRPKVGVNCVIRPENVSQLRTYVDYWTREGVDWIQLIHLQGTTPEAASATRAMFSNCKAVPHNLTGNEFGQFDFACLKAELAAIRHSGDGIVYLSPDLTDHELDVYYCSPNEFAGPMRRCVKPWHSLEVSARGDLQLSSVCVSLPLGPLVPGCFARAWRNPTLSAFRQLITAETRLPACLRCCAYFEGERVLGSQVYVKRPSGASTRERSGGK